MLSLTDVAEDIMEKYSRRYQQIKDNMERELQINKQYNDKVRKERDEKAIKGAREKAAALKEEYMDALEKRLEDRQEQYKRDWERKLAKEASKPHEEKLLDTMQLLLTQEIMNGGNSQQIYDHLSTNIENRKVVEMMSYHYANQDGADDVRAEINEALALPHESIENLKGKVRMKRANSDLIDFGGMGYNIGQDIGGGHADLYFNQGSGEDDKDTYFA